MGCITMHDWFISMSAQKHLPASVAKLLLDDGFVTIPGAVPESDLPGLVRSYERAIEEADSSDISVGRTTTRVSDFVNRSADFDHLYLYPPMLEACCRVIGQPFKLSTMHARTLRPRAAAQQLHVDFASDAQGFPMLGFIYMIDAFRADNGATRFVRGSQAAPSAPVGGVEAVPACGPAGSLILFNGSAWHGHGANETGQPRRSLQGAFIRRGEKSGGNLPARMLPRTLERIGPLARYLLDVEPAPGGPSTPWHRIFV